VSAKRASDRVFGLVFACLFGLIAAIGWVLMGRILSWAIAISGALLLLALTAPGILMPANRLWTLLGQRIAVVSNYVLLGLFFYLVILPFGLAGRLFRQSSMPKRPDPDADSYWTPVGRKTTVDSYADMF
jgi:hypothetical protein